jgi:hypothetical protein
MEDLDKESSILFNRLVIYRYCDQDSTFWIWKYPGKAGFKNWVEMKQSDLMMGVSGDVYQVDDSNKPDRNQFSFRIRLDSLKTFQSNLFRHR